ncbi:rod shape-determining protein RodA, partial [Marinomonas arenicola]
MSDNVYRRALSFPNARLWKLIHVDILLLCALLLLMAGGLVVLYSASGQDMEIVERQILRFG